MVFADTFIVVCYDRLYHKDVFTHAIICSLLGNSFYKVLEEFSRVV